MFVVLGVSGNTGKRRASPVILVNRGPSHRVQGPGATEMMRRHRTMVAEAETFRIRVARPALAFAVLLAQALTVGCVTPRSGPASRVREADDKMVAGCVYLGEVYGTGGGPTDIAIENAKTEAFEQASGKGATHVVWNALVPGKQSTVSGKAYRCTIPPVTPAQN